MILVDSTIPLLAQLLEPFGEVETFDHRTLSRQRLLQTRCHALFFRSTLRVTPALLDGTAVEFLGSVTSGSDHIHPSILSSSRYTVALARGANANAVAEYVLASIVEWQVLHDKNLAEHTIGIIGFGNIGRRVAEYAWHLGLQVLTNDPPLEQNGFRFPDYVHVVPLEALLLRSTIITNHVPLTTGGQFPTWRLLDRQRLSKSPTMLIIHTSRGGIIEERALLHAARQGTEVAVDVWEREPDVSPTLATRALIATPHIAGHSINAKIGASLRVAQHYYAYRDRRFDPPVLTIPPRILFSGQISLGEVRTRLQQSRQFHADTAFLRSIARRRKQTRISAIEHFRATYPIRYEVFRTSYDD